MKYTLFVFVFFFVILFNSCNKQTKSDFEVDNEPVYTVDFTQCLAMEQMMKVSEIADTVEYLELKTPKDIIITRIWNIIPVDDFWIIQSRGGIFKFTKEGDFVKQIGRHGEGPGEYLQIRGIDVDPVKKEIIQADMLQLLFYDYDGDFLRSTSIGDYLFNIGLSDSLFWTSSLSLFMDKNMACALNAKGDTVATVPNPNYGMKSLNTDGVHIATPAALKEFYRYDGKLYHKNRQANDTIFQLSGINRIPYVFLDMGKYKMPVEYEIWYSVDAYERNGSRYWGIPAVAEDDRYLYLTALRHRSLNDNFYEGDEDDWRYIVYDKKEGKGFVTKGEDGIKIIDDILGGPAIWPRYITEDYYICTVEWYELYPEVRKGNFNLAPSLEKQFDSLGYDTNELIVLCRKKK